MVALPATDETIGLIGAAELALLPKTALLVNIARARIIDEEALFAALSQGQIHAAGLDVWYQYPEGNPGQGGRQPKSSEPSAVSPSKFPFADLDNVVMSPHRAGTSMDTEFHRAKALADMLIEASEGREMANRVHVELGY
jgi:phosphoglycerate dehydrogenase-like enzyme